MKNNEFSTTGDAGFWDLRLYVAGQTAKSVAAFANLKRVCDDHLAGKYRIEVIDLSINPQLARGDQIVAVPTLVRKLPPPIRKIIGARPIHLEVDGGINASTVALVAEAGANVIVAGSGVFKGGTYADNIAAIRKNAERARAAAA